MYFDHAATTPMRPEARDAMLPYLGARFGNPSSVHQRGQDARRALEESRERLAALLGARRSEIVFTGGGTEADNLAVLGRSRVAGDHDAGRGPVAVSAVEHKAVLGGARRAAAEGAEKIILGVDDTARVELAAVNEALAARPAVLSVMWGNNEVGTLQPVAEIARRCRDADVVFHTDAVQAFGRVPVRVDDVPCDLLTLSAHKFGGPQGVGTLFVREGVELVGLAHGGGQERGMRPGTQNVAGAVGMARAAELAVEELESEAQRIRALRDRLEAGLREAVPDLQVNAGEAERLPHLLNVSLRGVDQEAVLVALDLEGIAAASGSACQSGSVEPSHVLTAMGRAAPDEASLRLSLGRTTSSAEIDAVLEGAPAVIERLRSMAAH